MTTGWESQLDTSVLEQSRQKILQVLNTGSLKDLKGLQQIGDKKAKLILGWREIHGHFAKVGFITEFGLRGAAPPFFLLVRLWRLWCFAVGRSCESGGNDGKEVFVLYEGKYLWQVFAMISTVSCLLLI